MRAERAGLLLGIGQQGLAQSFAAAGVIHPQRMHHQPAATDVSGDPGHDLAGGIVDHPVDRLVIQRIATGGLVEGQQAGEHRAGVVGAGGLDHRCGRHRGHQASRLCRRMVRDFSRAQSRSFSASRLSWVCLPLASAISSLMLFLLQYIAVGTIV